MKRICAVLLLVVLAALLSGCSFVPDNQQLKGRWSGTADGQRIEVYITNEFVAQKSGDQSYAYRYTLDQRGKLTMISPFTQQKSYSACILLGDDTLYWDGIYLQRED